MVTKQIFEIMETDPEKSLACFNAAVEDLSSSTYIIVAGKISRLLQSIASSRPLYELFLRKTRGYNFVDDFRSRQLRDESGRAYIDVPKAPDEQMRFAFCMLYAVDTGKLNFEKLLHTFYYDNDATAELRAFVSEVVRPLAENVNAALSTPTPEQAAGLVNSEEQPGFTENDIPPIINASEQQNPISEVLSDVHYATITNLTSELINTIAHDDSISTATREELLVVCDAFASAAEIKERKAVRLTFIALKNTLKNSPAFDKLSDKFSALCDCVSKLDIEVN